MIDPNIALAYKPVEVQDPLEVAARQASLKTIANQQQLQQAQLTGVNQENQQRQQQMTDDQQFRQLFNQSMQSGQPVSTGQIMQTLGPVRGSAYQKSVLETQKTQAEMKELSDKHATAEADFAGSLGYQIQQAGYSPQSVAAAVQQAHAAGYEQEAQQFAQVATQTPSAIKGVVDGLVSKSPKQQEIANARETSQARTSEAATAQDRLDWQQQNGQQQRDQAAANAAEAARHNKVTEGQGSQRIVISQDREGRLADGTGGSGQSVTANTNENIYDQSSKAEVQYSQQRSQIGSALKSGTVYVDQSGKATPFAQMKTADGSALGASDISAMQDQMRARYQAASKGMVDAIAAKNNAMMRNRQTPGVSTAQAAAFHQRPTSGVTPTSSGRRSSGRAAKQRQGV